MKLQTFIFNWNRVDAEVEKMYAQLQEAGIDATVINSTDNIKNYDNPLHKHSISTNPILNEKFNNNNYIIFLLYKNSSSRNWARTKTEPNHTEPNRCFAVTGGPVIFVRPHSAKITDGRNHAFPWEIFGWIWNSLSAGPAGGTRVLRPLESTLVPPDSTLVA